MWRSMRLMAVAGGLALGFTPACGDDDETAAQGGPVAVTLQEFAIGTSPPTASAGSVTFNITNKGPDDAHEFVVIRTDLDLTALPTKPDGSVDEEGEGIEVVDEQEEVEPGTDATLTVDLGSGAYVFICNITEKEKSGDIESHYQKGMRTSFTVS